MKTRQTVHLKPVGLLVFLATAAIGWNLASSPAVRISRKEEETKSPKHARRTDRAGVADAARTRISSLRAIADPEARFLATVALANSLSPDDFAAWMDGKWFTLRGGPEHLVFDRILMERWRNEDPEGLLVWSAKNNNGAADGIVADWAANDPQRLLEFYKSHPDQGREMSALSKIAKSSPQIALARFQEMLAAGLSGRYSGAADGVLSAILEKSPATLLDVLVTLPPEMKLAVEGMMSRKRLDASFSEEIRNLWERPDGWEVFSRSGIDEKTSEKLLGELANLPPEWRGALATNAWNVMIGGNTEKWYNADLEGAGFSPDAARSIRQRAVSSMAYQNPEAALARMAEIEMDPRERKRLQDQAVARLRDPEKVRKLIPLMTNGEDREVLEKKLETLSASPQGMPETPQDFLDQLGKLDGSRNSALPYFAELQNWDPQKVSEVSTRFRELPAEKKQQIAQAIIGGNASSSDTGELKGDALRYLLENPPPKKADADPFSSVAAVGATYVVNLSNQDPETAIAWVKKIPAGEDKSWMQKNLYSNWKQYDPKAAEQWKKSLPAAELEALEKLNKPH
ncbi:hypothetical protein JIN84_10820 [Luteolibacter yonseiensis]|uniref:Uncharacterized protein n=1 Tax=Luteolibacter yonseiensis TaxID=1144680 RepID=A0A934R625_9BACT|nr:hypothetical protein [Luteolibacter yonseiensis]MBK1816105.1 hypothetical protein [Luteolibacter yonseiensis]